MNENPTPKEWLKDNPGKSVNDYFQLFPSHNKISSTTHTQIDYYPEDEAATNGLNTNQLLGIILCIIGLVAFFLPWFYLRFLGFEVGSIKGSSLPNLAERLGNMNGGFSGNGYSSGFNVLNVLYLLPPLFMAYIFAEFQSSKQLKMIVGLSLFGCFALAVYRIFTEIPFNDVMHNLGVGFYLTVVVIVVLILKS